MAAGEDGLVRFELDAPDARDVFVAGTFNDWRPDVTPLTRREGGPWTADLELAPGRYEYKFIVDGAWCCDVGLDGPREWIDGAIPNAMGTSNRVIDVDE